jgi:hypothetical protein
MIDIAILIIGSSDDMTYREYYPAAFKFLIDDEFPSTVAAFVELLGDARAGGVRGFLEYTEKDDDDTFTFADADAIQVDLLRGFAEEHFDNHLFDDWTADDPDNWVVTGESAPNREISEVGTGESYGGSGSGAANVYTDSATLIAMQQAVTTVVGVEYELTFWISAISGDMTVRDISNDDFDERYTTTGKKTITWTSTGTTTTVRFFNSSTAVDATIDAVRMVGRGGAFAGVEEI